VRKNPFIRPLLQKKNTAMRFSNQEIKELIIAWALISVAFGIVFRHQTDLTTSILISAATVGVGFVLHELGHKIVAQRMGKFAEFRAFLPLLVFSVLLAFTGIVIAAPGAVMISGFVNRKENALIAAAGPIINIALCIPFFLLFLLAPVGSIWMLIGGFGFYINALLALFNMLPFWIFDGAKVIAHSKPLYAAITITSVILVFLAGMLGVF
jgi:Zn-dependent protease